MYYYPNNINKNNINILMYFSYPEKAVNNMKRYPQSAITLSNTFKLKLKSQTNTNTKVKQVFMVDDRSIVVYLSNQYPQPEYLVYISLSGQTVFCPLKFRSSVEQLNTNEFIVLNCDDLSVNKATLINNQWKFNCIIQSTIKDKTQKKMKTYKVQLFLFKETSSFCIVEQQQDIKEERKIVYYKPKGQSFKNVSEIIIKCASKENIFKVNEKSVIGWIKSQYLTGLRNSLERREKSTLHLINFENEKFNLTQKEIKYNTTNFVNYSTISRVFQLSPDVYLKQLHIIYAISCWMGWNHSFITVNRWAS